jgi:hypothetical protein
MKCIIFLVAGTRDSVVNQLLSKMDGIKEIGNVIVVGLTNRRFKLFCKSTTVRFMILSKNIQRPSGSGAAKSRAIRGIP